VNESAGQGERGTPSGGIILGPGEGRTIPGTDAITLKATGPRIPEARSGSSRRLASRGPGPPAIFTTVATNCSTSLRESFSS